MQRGLEAALSIAAECPNGVTPSLLPTPSTHSAWLMFGAIQGTALAAERLLRGRRVPLFSALHPHLRSALVQCATQTTLLVQVGGCGVALAAAAG